MRVTLTMAGVLLGLTMTQAQTIRSKTKESSPDTIAVYFLQFIPAPVMHEMWTKGYIVHKPLPVVIPSGELESYRNVNKLYDSRVYTRDVFLYNDRKTVVTNPIGKYYVAKP